MKWQGVEARQELAYLYMAMYDSMEVQNCQAMLMTCQPPQARLSTPGGKGWT